MPVIRFAPRAYVQSILRDVRDTLARVVRDRAALATIILIVLPWWALIFIRNNADWLWPFGEVVAIVFAFWWMSRSGALPAPNVKHPRAETLFAFALVALWVIWRAGICTQVFPFLPANFNCFKSWEFEILPKIIEQVVFPILFLFGLGYGWRAQGIHWSWRAWWISLPILLATTAYGIYLHWEKLPEFSRNFVEYFFAAGLPEEILFRAVLLTRLEAWWKNSAWAFFGASIIFGLSHLPIDYLVFTNRNWNETWITLLTFQMGVGAALVFAYQRTRNVLPLAVLHALIDAL